MNGGKIEDLPSSPAFDYEFKKDSSYLLFSQNGSSTRGTWTFDESSKSYKLYRIDGELSGQVELISSDKFTLKPDGKAVDFSPKDLKYYYISKK